MSKASIQLRYKQLCPNCGGDILSTDLEAGNFCGECQQNGKILRFKKYLDQKRGFRQFARFFHNKTGKHLNAFQKIWAKRALRGESFALSAPTGIGKTTFALQWILFQLQRKQISRAYILVPTRALVQQTANYLSRFTSVAAYLGRKADKQTIQQGNFAVLVSTTNFFYKNADLILSFHFDVVFVDDVDSYLKSSRKTHLLFRLLGFSEEEIRSQARHHPIQTQLLISSATVRATPQKLRLFRNLLGFDVGKFTMSLRNVTTFVAHVRKLPPLEEITRVCKKMQNGILIFFPQGTDASIINDTIEHLNQSGIRTGHYQHFVRDFPAFERGEIAAFVGIAHPYNPLVRGIDSPSIKYVIFADLLHYRISVEKLTEASSLLSILKPLRYFQNLPEETHRRLSRFLQKQRWKESDIATLKNFINSLLQKPRIFEYLNNVALFTLEKQDNQFVLVVPDTTSFIQALGRTSRLSSIGVYSGAAVIFYQNPNLLAATQRKIAITDQPLDLKKLTMQALQHCVKKIEKERAELLQSQVQGKALDFPAILIIVESPTKARTIARFYGQPQIKIQNRSVLYEVCSSEAILTITASLGHVFDLSTSDGLWGVEIPTFRPVYESIRQCQQCGKQLENIQQRCCEAPEVFDKQELVDNLRNIALDFDTILIATDPDTEGEKISYDLFCALRPINKNIVRSEFHEVTKKAFENALRSARKLNKALVAAQILRRIYDRWVGFYLSQFLQKRFQKKNLSAGRVQTPVLGWIVNRTAQLKQHLYQISFIFRGLPVQITVEKLQEVTHIKQQLNAAQFHIDFETAELSPPPPFTTSTILQQANHLLKLDSSTIMATLQKLFELGFITYHRTDSIHISSQGQFVAREFIIQRYGENLFVPRQWAPPGTHEAIRITKPIDEEELRFLLANRGISSREQNQMARVYRLILQRFIASQMKAAQVKHVKLRFSFNGITFEESYPAEILEPGFTLISPIRLYAYKPDGELERLQTRKVPKYFPYTEAEVVNEMKEQKIGRPSTYAIVLETLKIRRYVILIRNFLYATTLGKKVFSLLSRAFPQFVSVNFTRELEEKIDQVEQKGDYRPEIQYLFIKLFSSPDHPALLDQATEAMQRNPEQLRS